MAAPTDFRVEAESQTTTKLRWTYTGAAEVSVHRSTDGMSYAEVTDATSRVQPGTTEFEDVDLEPGTKYWYKVSDDAGSTFSDVDTVTTHSCGVVPAKDGIMLPRFTGEDEVPLLNQLAETVEDHLQHNVSTKDQTCEVCVVDRTLVINCECELIEVEVTTDVNSISLLNCEDSEVDITFIIPPDTTVGIGGWPRGIGFTGDEYWQAPIAGGANGRTATVSIGGGKARPSARSKPGTSTDSTKGGGGTQGSGGCTCTPGSEGELTIRVCSLDGSSNPDNSLGCQNASKGALLVACGGRGPYTWSKTGDVELSPTTGPTTRVTPPENSGSGVAGVAYTRGLWGIGQGHISGTTHPAGAHWAIYGCDDAFDSCSTTTGGAITACAYIDAAPDCATHDGHPVNGTGGVCDNLDCGTICTEECACAQANGSLQDRRSAQMIADGCTPCGLQQGSTVTVTDSLGTQVTIILRG